MDLTDYALSGLAAAQARLATASHNLDNATTPGYNRQQVITTSAGGVNAGSGYIGQGVSVQTVQRSVSNFINQQLNGAQTRASALQTFGTQIAQVNNLFADRTVGLYPTLQNFFSGIQGVASTPADPSARQEALGSATALVGQFNSTNDFLNAQRADINGQVQTTVNQINASVARIQTLNQQIVAATGNSGGQPPNDLLDARDQEVADLNKLVNVTVYNQNGQYTVTVGNGQLLLAGGTQFNLVAAPSQSDPSETSVFASIPSGPGGVTSLSPISETTLSGGALGGLLTYRRETLDPVQQQVGMLATGLALSVNAVQTSGLDAEGNPGKPMFAIGNPGVIQNAKNTGSATVSATLAANNAQALQPSNYTLSFDGTNYTITRNSDGSTLYRGASVSGVPVDGTVLSVTGSAHAGDTWQIAPVQQGAGTIALAISTGDQIAAADSSGGSANGNNALAMAQLQSNKTLNGGLVSFSDAYSTLVNQVGEQTQQNTNDQTSQNSLVTQNYNAQQSVSGVNVDEEYVNIQQYQNQYQAAAKLVQVSNTLFAALLGVFS
ncbi:MAG: flagellar hook-associated protein FlgK [Candidimonas sp.]|nr:MAG: flagellar hook-associated protein FlgK [Candidimonas sp.]